MQAGFQTGNADKLPVILVSDAYEEFVEKIGDDPEIIFKIRNGEGVVTTSSPLFAAFVNEKLAVRQA